MTNASAITIFTGPTRSSLLDDSYWLKLEQEKQLLRA